ERGGGRSAGWPRVGCQNWGSRTSLGNGRIASAAKVANETMKTSHCAPRRSPRPEPKSGTRAQGTNLAAPPIASSAPRTAGERMKTSAQTTKAAVSESFEFDSSTNVLYGYATHA